LRFEVLLIPVRVMVATLPSREAAVGALADR
jgi:hypothetical protein